MQRDETSLVTDYAGEGAASDKLLSREQSAQEVTWSGGHKLPAQAVAAAFQLPGLQAPDLPADVKPLSTGSNGFSFKTALILFAVVVIVVLLLSRFSSDNCDDERRAFGANSNEYQQCARSGGSGRVGGGSFGGYSSGGGHK